MTFAANGRNDHVTMFILYLPHAVFSFSVKLSTFGLASKDKIVLQGWFHGKEIIFSNISKGRPLFFRVCLGLTLFCWLDPLLQDPVLLFCRGGPCKHSSLLVFTEYPFSYLVCRVHTRFSKIHTGFQTFRLKWLKSIPYFRPKRHKNHALWHRSSLNRGVLLPHPHPDSHPRQGPLSTNKQTNRTICSRILVLDPDQDQHWTTWKMQDWSNN